MMLHKPEELKGSSRLETTQLVGWREWVALPSIMDEPIRAKVDTGARTSALHAPDLSLHQCSGRTLATFTLTDTANTERLKTVEVVEQRSVRSSNGVEEVRPVVVIELVLGTSAWPIELTLTDREMMGFPMLIGRSALRNRCLIDPNRSYCAGLPSLPILLSKYDLTTPGVSP